MSDELTLDSSNEGFDKEQQRQAASKISDEQLKKLALQHSKKEGTFKRPSETIDLPSKGMLYDLTNPLSSGQIELYHPTARDEDILMTSSKIKKGTVIDDFISALIASPINYDDLLVGDRDKLVIVARILAYGAKYKATVNDPDIPSESQDVEFNLQDVEEIGINESETTPNTNLFSFKLPTSELTVSFKLPTVGMNKKIDEEIKRTKQLSTKVDRSLSVRLKHLIVDIEGESSRSVINDFVDNQLLTMDSKALRTYIKSVSPGIDLSYNFISDLTDKQRRLEIPIGNPNFFWPNS